MNKQTAPEIPANTLALLAEAALLAMSSVRDPEIMRQACAEMDRIREEIKKEHGVLDIGVPAIRELREGE